MRFTVRRTSQPAWLLDDKDVGNPPCAGAVRDGEVWTLDVADLGALCELVRTNGRVIVERDPDDTIAIEIYDDWRE